MKVVINNCYGGFGLNDEQMKRWREISKKPISEKLCHYDIERDDPALVQLVEEGCKGDVFASLSVVEIPDGVAWEIEEYDGREWVAETHRTWS